MKYYQQKNLSVTDEQRKFIEANHGKMEIRQIAVMLGLNYGKTYHNIKLMGLTKPMQSKVIKMDEHYFDVDNFAKKYYNF